MSFGPNRIFSALALALVLSIAAPAMSLISSSAHASETAQTNWKAVTENIYRELETKLPGKWVRVESSAGEYEYKKLTADGDTAITLRVSVNSAYASIYVEEMRVQRGYKGQGYSTLIFAKMLIDFPGTQVVTGNMAWDNEKALRSVLPLALGDFNMAPKSKQLRAVQATPFYKALSRFGFTEWDSSQTTNSEMVFVALKRP